jgi:nitrate reductase alpha subunit
MSLNLQTFQTMLSNFRTVEESVMNLLHLVSAEMKDALNRNQPAELHQMADDLTNHAQVLTQAVLQNTSADSSVTQTQAQPQTAQPMQQQPQMAQPQNQADTTLVPRQQAPDQMQSASPQNPDNSTQDQKKP